MNNTNPYKTGDDLFVIPVTDDNFILYSPLRRLALRANRAEVRKISSFIKNSQVCQSDPFYDKINRLGLLEPLDQSGTAGRYSSSIHPFSTLTLSLTHECNLDCVYCFDDGITLKSRLSTQIITAALDKVTAECKTLQKNDLQVSLRGTGEPLLHWDLLVQTVEMAESKAASAGLSAKFWLVTNGTLINKERARYLKDHHFHLTLSMDGFDWIQNRQRPYRDGSGTFDDVMSGIEYLNQFSVPFDIRASVTSLGIDHLEDIIRFFARYVLPSGGKVRFEPAEIYDPTVATQLARFSADRFIESFKKAVQLGEKHQLEVFYSGDLQDIPYLYGANEGIFCVLPTGKASACTRVTRQDDPLADAFFYADYDPVTKGFMIDEERLDQLRKLGLSDQTPPCLDCFCKWHCAGHCISARLSPGMGTGKPCATSPAHWENGG